MKKKYLFLIIAIVVLIVCSLKIVNNSKESTPKKNSSNVSTKTVNDKNSNLTFDTSEFEKLNKDDLIRKRDKLIDENLSIDKSVSEEENKRTKKNLLLNDSWTLVGYVEYKYPNLDDREKLMKQINLIQFANFLGHRMDPSGQYFMILDENSQYDDFLKFKKREDLRDISSTSTVKEKMKYLAKNIDELSSFVDIPKENIIENFTNYYQDENSSLSEKEKNEIKGLIENFKK